MTGEISQMTPAGSDRHRHAPLLLDRRRRTNAARPRMWLDDRAGEQSGIPPPALA